MFHRLRLYYSNATFGLESSAAASANKQDDFFNFFEKVEFGHTIGSFAKMDSFDITKLARILREVDTDNSDSEDETDKPSKQRLSNFGPAQIGACSSKTAKTTGKNKGEVGDDCVGSGDSKSQKNSKIWSESEVQEKETLCNNAGPLGDDPRAIPTYDMFFRQSVSTEDMFLGMGNKNASTASCENIVVEISLPSEDHHKIKLDLKSQLVELRSPKYILFLPLPQPVDPRAGNAKWDGAKEKLIITLVLSRELDILNF